ncbi:MAG: hypothetical protein C4516_04140 [Oxalobacter sp.]|nr:MAG: hypothetical protein C4516_04140 [Oxalobacter sp.]
MNHHFAGRRKRRFGIVSFFSVADAAAPHIRKLFRVRLSSQEITPYNVKGPEPRGKKWLSLDSPRPNVSLTTFDQ